MAPDGHTHAHGDDDHAVHSDASHDHADHSHPGHDHGHGGHGHSHAPSLASVDAPKWLWIALALNLLIVGVEIVAGIAANSTALLTDAAHVVADGVAIVLVLIAIRIARRPATNAYTYGLARVEILSAQINGVVLLVLAVLVGVEAIRRLFSPPEVHGALVVAASVFGLLANAGAAWALARASRRSLAVEGAFQHALMDAIASVAAIIAGVVIMAGGPDVVDPLLALFVTALMLRSGWALVSASTRILLEGTPSDLDTAELGTALAGHAGVVEVHDLHVWELTQGFPAVTAHVVVGADQDCHRTRLELQTLLRERFDVQHVTLQVDHDHTDELVQLQPKP